MAVSYIHCQFSRVVPGSATLQRGFWSRAGARRSQEEGTGTGLAKWTSRVQAFSSEVSRDEQRYPEPVRSAGSSAGAISGGAVSCYCGLDGSSLCSNLISTP